MGRREYVLLPVERCSLGNSSNKSTQKIVFLYCSMSVLVGGTYSGFLSNSYSDHVSNYGNKGT